MGRVLRYADGSLPTSLTDALDYPPCPMCGRTDWAAISEPEFFRVLRVWWVRQAYRCPTDRVRIRFGRELQWTWWTSDIPRGTA